MTFNAGPGIKHSTCIHPRCNTLYTSKAGPSSSCGPQGACTAEPVETATLPRGPWLTNGLCCPIGSTLTTTSSETLRSSHRLIFFVLVGLCPLALSGRDQRGSPICFACLFFRAIVRTPAGRATANDWFFVAPTGLRHFASGSAPTRPFRRFLKGRVTRLQRSLNATARKTACPTPTRTFTTKLSPPLSHPNGVLVITTRATSRLPGPDSHRLGTRPYGLQYETRQNARKSKAEARAL